MGHPLDRSALDRLGRALRPDWTRTPTARRVLAGGLVLLAAAAAWRGDPSADMADVVVTAHDLSPGAAITAADLQVERRAMSAVPEGAQTAVDAVVGATLAGPARRGEILTDVRLLGPRLAESAAGPDARIVPIPLADAALTDLVRTGDVVDVVAAPVDEAAEPRVIATDAVVVLVSAKDSGIGARGSGRVVLVALPSAAAKSVAGAALVSAVTLTLH
ncbi:SAF domain-containing protein [Mycobacterium sp. ITM-2016-00317]|uniref:SAF domain-containing protein n=1 Tax=Mycobacterium sp. ITM-2016-00317 TaxID=2099694 RepID=UPI000D46F7D7|nr:SAF domain-containing protein [Mycobacterium sp. ITM-2016-00317]WNG86557.1 SAF domain-containing protein [Mycobacterium sp. ITM-2016-00317]